MTRDQLEHLLRASANVLNDLDRTPGKKRELVVVGSQSVLGQYPDSPPELLRSMEADMYPRAAPERADAIDGALGELSSFHGSYGMYVQGVGPDTAVLPRGWEARVVRIDTAASDPGIGLCLEVHDLAISKYVAGRNKDIEFTAELSRQGLTNRVTLLERLAVTEVPPTVRKIVAQRIASQFHNRR